MKTRSQATDIRATMVKCGRSLPAPCYALTQRILTWITGKALPGQSALWGGIPGWAHLAGMLFLLIGSAMLTVGVCRQGGMCWMVLPVTIALTLSASRTLWLTDLHAAAHNSFSRSRLVNKLVGNGVSLLLMVLPHELYRRSHCIDHHSPRTFCSREDPDAGFLYWMGLQPGKSKKDLRRRLLFGILSPRVHGVFLASRLHANFVSSGWLRSLLSAGYLAALGLVAVRTSWLIVFVAWLLPVGLFYQMSAIVGWAGEHTWFAPKTGDLIQWQHDRTHGRFFGAAFPKNASPGRVAWWLLQMTGHLILRLMFVPGDLPNHDWHHRYPSSPDWMGAAYARQRAIDNGDLFPLETWGLFKAIDRGLSSIAAQTPLAIRSASTTEAMETFGAM